MSDPNRMPDMTDREPGANTTTRCPACGAVFDSRQKFESHWIEQHPRTVLRDPRTVRGQGDSSKT